MSISVQTLNRYVVGIGGKDTWIYNEIHIPNIDWKKHKWKCMAEPGISTRDPCIKSKVLCRWVIEAN